MNGSIFEWEQHCAFLAVVRERSLSGAARALDVAQPTVRRRIEALEERLQIKLFTRSPTGLHPTETARSLLAHAEAMEVAAEAFARAATGEAGGSGGTVRVAVTETLGVEVLPGMLAGFHAAHPGLSLELSLGTRLEKLAVQESDIAIRHIRPTEEATVSRHIGDFDVGLFATQGFLATMGTPASMDELARFALVGPDRAMKDIRKLQQHGLTAPASSYAVRTDNHLAQFAAIRAGLGIGPCHAPLARREGLVRVLPDEFTFKIGLWLAMHEDLRQVHRVRIVFDFLAEALATYARHGR